MQPPVRWLGATPRPPTPWPTLGLKAAAGSQRGAAVSPRPEPSVQSAWKGLHLLCSSDSGSPSTPKESGSILWFGPSQHAQGLEGGQWLRPSAHRLYLVEGDGGYGAVSVSALSFDFSVPGWGPGFSPTLSALTRTPDLQPPTLRRISLTSYMYLSYSLFWDCRASFRNRSDSLKHNLFLRK